MDRDAWCVQHGPQSMRSQSVRHEWVTELKLKAKQKRKKINKKNKLKEKLCVCSFHQGLLLKLAHSTCVSTGWLEHRLPWAWLQGLEQLEEALEGGSPLPGWTHDSRRLWAGVVLGSTGPPAARAGLGGGGAQAWNPSRLARAWADWGDRGLRGERARHTSPSWGCWAGACSHHCPRKLVGGQGKVLQWFHPSRSTQQGCLAPTVAQDPPPTNTAGHPLTASCCPLPRPTPQIPSPAPSPPPHREAHRLGCEGLQHGLYAQAPLRPAAHTLAAAFPSHPEVPLRSWPPLWACFPECGIVSCPPASLEAGKKLFSFWKKIALGLLPSPGVQGLLPVPSMCSIRTSLMHF